MTTEIVKDPHHEFPEEQTAMTPMDLLHVAVTQGAAVEQLGKLMELQLKWEANEEKKKFYEAMRAFKAEVPNIVKNKTASFTGKNGSTVSYDYATLDNVCEKLMPALSKHGLTHKWRTSQENGKIRVTCVLSCGTHSEDGATLEASPDESGSKNPIQAIGSTKSYLERYTFLSACGVAVKGMDTDTAPEWEKLQEFLDSIATCPNVNVLESTFKSGFKEAMAISDTHAMKLLTAAKDAKKVELAKERL